MGKEVVYVMMLMFSDWDECWDYWHERIKSHEHTYEVCTAMEIDAPPVRPRARPEKNDG
jgi:hypothetical protein